MPIEVGIWKLGKKLNRVEFQSIETEAKLEDTLVADMSVLSPGLMLIGRQILTAFGKLVDLLAIDRNGDLVIIELKRDKTPREVVAQALDYASWTESLSYEQIAEIYSEKNDGKKFEAGFDEAFDGIPPENINESHRMIVVASELDPSAERIINYLSNNYGVPINTVFFRYFKDGDSEYLTRTWLIDPQEAEVKASKSGGKRRSEPWNGRDFYVSLGDGERRTWEDCLQFGFVSGGGGKWYTQTLSALFPGARVFVNIPKTGFVGVGEVVETVKPVTEFQVAVDGAQIPILEAPGLKATGMDKYVDDAEMCEYIVRVKWLKTVSKDQAFWEKWLFAVQHTACRLRNRFTIEHLTQYFELDD